MAKKKKLTDDDGRAADPIDDRDSESSIPAPVAERVTVPLDDHGQVDWDRMRPRTAEKLRAAMGASSISTSAPFAAEEEPAIDASVIGVLYTALGSIAVNLARSSGYAADQADTLLFTVEEKTALLEPTSKVLNKYAGTMGRWQDEIMLAFLLSTILSGKVSALRKSTPVLAFESPHPPEAAS